MNEGLSVFLHIDPDKPEENENLIRKIDRLLLGVGMKYSGFCNMYIPEDSKNRDRAVFEAHKALREVKWLKGILAYTLVANLTNACSLDKILTDHMSDPSPEKLRYYEQYYQSCGELAHSIVVDENKQLRDGYISYILALKYGICPNIYASFSDQPLRKTVIGRHVKFSGNKWKVSNDKRYRWIYTLKNPVVPGDVLQVQTKKGLSFICVDNIDYVTGEEFCAEYKCVKRHTDMCLER